MLHVALVYSILFCVVFHCTTFPFKDHSQDDHKFTQCDRQRTYLSLLEEDTLNF